MFLINAPKNVMKASSLSTYHLKTSKNQRVFQCFPSYDIFEVLQNGKKKIKKRKKKKRKKVNSRFFCYVWTGEEGMEVYFTKMH